MRHFLDFEKPIAELEGKIEELRRMSEPDGINIAEEVGAADRQGRPPAARDLRQADALAEDPGRAPSRTGRRPCDYIAGLITEFTPLAGDRAFADDAAVVGGLGRFRGRAVVVLGTEKGTDTESRVKHNFGMARPEGYRKARRLMELAGRFGLPVLTFVDTAGAFPGIDAEARGQAEAIARSIEACLEAPVPVVATIIGEGGSGGAIALAAGDRGADAGARDLLGDLARGLRLDPVARRGPGAGGGRGAAAHRRGPASGSSLIDAIIPEPLGGAQRDAAATVAAVGEARGGGAGAAGGAGWGDAAGAAAGEVPGDGARGAGVRPALASALLSSVRPAGRMRSVGLYLAHAVPADPDAAQPARLATASPRCCRVRVCWRRWWRRRWRDARSAARSTRPPGATAASSR